MSSTPNIASVRDYWYQIHSINVHHTSIINDMRSSDTSHSLRSYEDRCNETQIQEKTVSRALNRKHSIVIVTTIVTAEWIICRFRCLCRF